MVKPKPAATPVPQDDETEDDYVPGGGPAPASPPADQRGHPIEPPSGNQSPRHPVSSSGTPRNQGDQSPRGLGDSKTGNQGDQEARGRGDQVTGQEDPYAGRVKIGPRIPADLRKRLKLAAAQLERNEELIVAEALREWFDRHPY